MFCLIFPLCHVVLVTELMPRPSTHTHTTTIAILTHSQILTDPGGQVAMANSIFCTIVLDDFHVVYTQNILTFIMRSNTRYLG